jgi:tetratricopeptide (TPR) repeat protein
LLAQLGLAPPPVEAAPEEIEVEVEPDIDLGEEELVVEAAAGLEYEPSAAAAEIDLDEGYTEASDEIAAALADEPFDLEEASVESAVVSGESIIPQSRQRPSEIMGAHAHGVSTAETSSASGSSAVNLTPSEPAIGSEAMTEQRTAPRSPASVDLDELDELLAGAPRMAEPRPVAQAGQPAAVDEPILQEPIPAGPGLEDEVEEIEFFLQQGLEDEAHDALEALLLGHPEHPELLRLKAELQAAQAEPEPEPVQVDEDIPEPETVKIETIDLAAELAQELDAAAEDEDFQVSFADVFDEFKRGVAEQVDDSDHQTHYDLGIAYKEMGLLDDAVREFGLAVRAPDAQIGALTMIGICKLELGRTSDALEHFLQGLNSDAVTAEEALALRFEIGRAYESMGKLGEATKFYEKVHAMDASFRDVTTRLREVKNAGGDSAEVSDELDALLTETAAERSARGKISYV